MGGRTVLSEGKSPEKLFYLPGVKTRDDCFEKGKYVRAMTWGNVEIEPIELDFFCLTPGGATLTEPFEKFNEDVIAFFTNGSSSFVFPLEQ